MPYTTLISVADLVRNINSPDWLVVDCRFDLANKQWGRAAYAESHIPGAIYAHLDDDLSAPIVPGVTGRHPLPSIEQFAATLARWGIDERVQVVTYDDKGGMFAARLWWMLRWLGHEKVAVLDGGWKHWLDAGQPVSADVPTRAARTFTPRPQLHLEASVDDVVAALNDPAIKLLDARGADRFRGENETIDPKAGHIPGAKSVPFMENLTPDGLFLDQEALRTRFRALLGDTQSRDTICYCGSGVTACHNVLAMLHAGLGDARLYAGSWSHWITDPDRPVAMGEE
ncbi:MAG: sulfurtransferase [Nitrospirota bacterium]|nr:sulfurtransferase [Nitrospirota bacterium]